MRVKVVEAIWPAEFTLTMGMYVLGGEIFEAVKVRIPEGFVSDAAYFS